MAIYRCPYCDRLIDDDYDPGEDFDGELVCPDCVEKAEEEKNHG